jgi:hypothetical protein
VPAKRRTLEEIYRPLTPDEKAQAQNDRRIVARMLESRRVAPSRPKDRRP